MISAVRWLRSALLVAEGSSLASTIRKLLIPQTSLSSRFPRKTDSISDQAAGKTDPVSDQAANKAPKLKLSKIQQDIRNFCSIPRNRQEILHRAGVSDHFNNRKK